MKQSITDWIALTGDSGKNLKIPITLHTKSGSMAPFIRIGQDEVKVVPCRIEDIRVGDVVLVIDENSPAGVLLHRLYAIKDGKLITLGDNMLRKDRPHEPRMLLGRAVSVKGPKKDIDCGSRWSRLKGLLTVKTFFIRPAFFLARRAVKKLGRVLAGLRKKA